MINRTIRYWNCIWYCTFQIEHATIALSEHIADYRVYNINYWGRSSIVKLKYSSSSGYSWSHRNLAIIHIEIQTSYHWVLYLYHPSRKSSCIIRKRSIWQTELSRRKYIHINPSSRLETPNSRIWWCCPSVHVHSYDDSLNSPIIVIDRSSILSADWISMLMWI